MPILNYTTTIPVEKTAAEIQKSLVKFGATGVMTQFSPEGMMTSITFSIDLDGRPLYFTLPADHDSIYVLLQKDKKVARRYKTREQASRVAWRIIKDWIEAQLALVETQMVDLPEVFLPYMQTGKGGTLYAELKNRNLDTRHLLEGPGK